MTPHGATVTPDFVPNALGLFEAVRDEVCWTEQMRSRKTASMGVPYNYAGASYPVASWHPAIQALADRVEAAVGFTPTNCLLNYYPTGRHNLGWHHDDTDILAPGTGIAIVSLGVARPLKLRTTTEHGFHYEELLLPPGSLLMMSAEMQSHWLHSMRRHATQEARISLTFRQIVRWDVVQPVLTPR
ncbi:MAG: alpha-ketoglutarate-dependent dioxygenase AlkB [Rhodobacterales bacterium]|nr:alpha-ketoglutarate-dependent dioxygenase AlkB [Rhodobacterales bacterium]